tara:strand:- start:472 stop:1197 length:726 start_codon:yes stop_codon:yes gene_type:complete
MMLLFDIGNTNTVCAIYDGEYIKIDRFDFDKEIDSMLNSLSKYNIFDIAISSVVPNLTEKLIIKINQIFKINPFIITHKNSKLKLKVDSPEEVGTDRICNVKAAINTISNNCIVVDFGTATTYDVINNKKEFIGGAIAPGIDVSAHYLIEKAALLKNTVLKFPSNIIGKNTKTNIQSGVMYSAIFSIEGMAENIKKQLIGDTNIILTGGFSTLISPKLSIKHILKPNLTLDGIKTIYEENN